METAALERAASPSLCVPPCESPARDARSQALLPATSLSFTELRGPVVGYNDGLREVLHGLPAWTDDGRPFVDGCEAALVVTL